MKTITMKLHSCDRSDFHVNKRNVKLYRYKNWIVVVKHVVRPRPAYARHQLDHCLRLRLVMLKSQDFFKFAIKKVKIF